MRSLLLVASLLLATPVLSAPPARAGSDSPLERCLAQNAGATPGIVHVRGCYQAAQTRIDAALDKARTVTRGKLQANRLSPATLDSGEAAWRTYRDRWCAFEATAERDPGARAVTGLQCRVELSQAHLARLQGAL